MENYTRVEKVTAHGEFSIKGDIIDLWCIGYSKPIRLEFFGEELESSYYYDELYGRKIKNIKYIIISKFNLKDSFDITQIKINEDLDLSQNKKNKYLIFTQFIPENIRSAFSDVEVNETDYSYPQLFFNRLDILEKELKRYEEQGYSIAIHTKNWEKIGRLSPKYGIDENIFEYDLAELKKLPAGFESESKREIFLTDREIYGTIHLGGINENSTDKTIRVLKQLESDINIGDFIVHEDYGVGIYRGIVQESSGSMIEDYLLLEYDKEDQLYVPISHINKLTKYISDGINPKFTRLGKKEWDRIKKKVKNSVGILARELVEHYAKRHMAKTERIDTTDSKEYNDFCDKFPYELTTDQSRSINEVLDDLEKTEPMNRLIVGDVGFGKTEVIIRAAFKMCESGHQVAILCPTTVLASQHYSVFKDRYKSTNYKVESLSRFNSAKENQSIIDEINKGKVDIVIGTHRMLSSDVKFKKLGLLVVDEEQKFGVGQKEKIRKINYGVHYLSVTATPIPRTLSMALSTIQDMSIISTPPKERISIATELIKNDWNKIVKAIEFEINRGGQIYFIHNSVQTIQSIQQKLERLMPNVKFVYAHGQMPVKQLDKVITDFYDKKYQVLISTTIIENGIDMPNVNTMIINRAHHFGLSQLYQLRGRIGRSNKQAYCYLFYEGRDIEKGEEKELENKKLKPQMYLERLETILNSSELGSGFKIASKDLEIRGAGNLLGHQQSGNINTIGYSMYMKLLSQEVEKLRNGKEEMGIISF